MPVTIQQPNDKLVRKDAAVEYMRTAHNLDTFTVETLKHYAYRTTLLPRPKIVGRHAYWHTADLDRLVETL
jgi:hypothetical protein